MKKILFVFVFLNIACFLTMIFTDLLPVPHKAIEPYSEFQTAFGFPTPWNIVGGATSGAQQIFVLNFALNFIFYLGLEVVFYRKFISKWRWTKFAVVCFVVFNILILFYNSISCFALLIHPHFHFTVIY